MSKLTKDQIGRLAEYLAEVHLSRTVRGGYGRPLFRPASLGDKYPTVDFLVDIVGRNDAAQGFFFVQVKGTALGSAGKVRLPVMVGRVRFNRLVRLPAPTYLIGVDVTAETVHLVAAYKKRRSRVSSITKAYDLRHERTMIDLYEEVLAFWKANKPILRHTKFKDV